MSAATAHPTTTETTDAAAVWSGFVPGGDRPWNGRLAAHLLRRTGDGPGEEAWQAAVETGLETTLERLLQPGEEARRFNAQFDALEPSRPGGAEALSAWWLRRMLETPHPFTEWLTLFWHGALAVRADQLPEPGLLTARLRRLRALALAPLREIVAAQLSDPAVLLAFGEGANRRHRPNLELARAFLPDFAVGPEQTTEEDLEGAARAMSGWFVRRLKPQFVAREHDPIEKTILGRRGPWGRDDLVRIVAAHPAFHRRLAERLFRALVSEVESPNERVLVPLADRITADSHLAGALRMILRSERFYAEAGRGSRVKSPVELAVGLLRGAPALAPTTPLARDLTNLGQDLARPPTRRGWAGGARWITDRTVVLRANLLTDLLAKDGRYKGRLRGRVNSPTLLRRLWPGIGPEPPVGTRSPDDLLRRLLVPAFQLA